MSTYLTYLIIFLVTVFIMVVIVAAAKMPERTRSENESNRKPEHLTPLQRADLKAAKGQYLTPEELRMLQARDDRVRVRPSTAPSAATTSPPAGAKKVTCPRCRSKQVAAHRRGFSFKKAAAGVAAGLFLLPGGVLWGFHGSSAVQVTCMNCGHSWKAGAGR